MSCQEDLSEARRESSSGGFVASQHSCHRGSVAGQEMVHGLLIVESADWRQNSVGVTGQEDDVARMAAQSWFLGGWDVLDRIADSRVLSDRNVVEVHNSTMWISESDVLEHTAKLDSLHDQRLIFRVQLVALGIRASLDICDTGFTSGYMASYVQRVSSSPMKVLPVS